MYLPYPPALLTLPTRKRLLIGRVSGLVDIRMHLKRTEMNKAHVYDVGYDVVHDVLLDSRTSKGKQ